MSDSAAANYAEPSDRRDGDSRKRIVVQAANRLDRELVVGHVAAADTKLDVRCAGDDGVAAASADLSIWRARRGDSAVLDEARTALETRPGSTVLLLLDEFDAEFMRQAGDAGVRGVLAASCSAQVLTGVINLLLAGGTYMPFDRARPGFNETRPAAFAARGGGEGKAGIDSLTRRQREVLALLGAGKSNKTIAGELGMQESTVKVHIQQIMRKLEVENRTQAALIAVAAGIAGAGGGR